jgi:hypothetical protein
MIVPEKQLPRANGMMQMVWSLSGILSPMVAAGIITLPGLARQGVISGGIGEALAGMSDGTPIAIAIDAVTFFMAASVLPLLNIPSPKRSDLGAAGQPQKSLLADVKRGAIHLAPPPATVLGTSRGNFVGSPMQISPPADPVSPGGLGGAVHLRDRPGNLNHHRGGGWGGGRCSSAPGAA